ncbi:Holliday junction branch migration protein RuvA [Aureibacillus halotolerans]|uniref:Holliday junction branch migration complex subunit RuvA n=1 Tax=Aureibacillus halotolerans TaxID=1508390 RepID=A0A4R6TVX7_9BACI|nr:Holliday junction branch migration protein RuvA [Aureibacillus halotolerans]TDQ37978.1 Holliday junction DNA helicase subunit RuvA [Aureibacillus halotolerans]
MYDFIKGTVAYVCPQYITLDVNGVGYQLLLPHPLQYEAKKGEVLQLFTHFYVREDAQHLYGFPTREDRILFQLLLSVTGIGPKGGLAILAAGRLEDIVKAIDSEDETFLMKFPGIGKKTARQMILDLKGKVSEFLPSHQMNLVAATEEATMNTELEEAAEALLALGYSQREVDKIRPLLEHEDLTAEAYVKKALQMMLEGKRRR